MYKILYSIFTTFWEEDVGVTKLLVLLGKTETKTPKKNIAQQKK